MKQTNTAFVKTIRTKPLKTSDKPQYNGKSKREYVRSGSKGVWNVL